VWRAAGRYDVAWLSPGQWEEVNLPDDGDVANWT
jgi:hypothetical protein